MYSLMNNNSICLHVPTPHTMQQQDITSTLDASWRCLALGIPLSPHFR